MCAASAVKLAPLRSSEWYSSDTKMDYLPWECSKLLSEVMPHITSISFASWLLVCWLGSTILATGQFLVLSCPTEISVIKECHTRRFRNHHSEHRGKWTLVSPRMWKKFDTHITTYLTSFLILQRSSTTPPNFQVIQNLSRYLSRKTSPATFSESNLIKPASSSLTFNLSSNRYRDQLCQLRRSVARRSS